ncbi:DUF5805 domain-containing protein [Halomarina halobia]|uniref:DUF5805 domain-containing protein n=1 Tax=Halomarina halobia TaxID=3033386 RepID=A0ABD6ACJ4_9EURY|nr:DUF5805 domain-containing protein [Halomarina sp. PSR21]
MADRDTSRTQITTYLPVYQKREWQAHAEELEMSQSEYLRTMVQAGRRGFSLDVDREVSADAPADDGTPGGDGLRTRLLGILREGDYRSWDALVSALTADIEDDLEEELERLQAENVIRYSGRRGGYTLVEAGGDDR